MEQVMLPPHVVLLGLVTWFCILALGFALSKLVDLVMTKYFNSKD